MARVICPECLNVLEHDRGYLPLHMRNVQRGQLVTGSQMCPLSNTKLVTERKKIEYNNTCEDCGIVTEITVTEEHPGSFDHIQPFLEVDCIGCSVDHDGYYCENQGCGLEVTQRQAFFRVSDSQSTYVPSSGPSTSKYLDFDTEAEASALIETWPEYESGRYNLDAMPAGWYAEKGHPDFPAFECRSADPMAPSEHVGSFKSKHRKTVLITDGFVIIETPEEDRDDDPRAEDFATSEPPVIEVSGEFQEQLSSMRASMLGASPASPHEVELWHDTTMWNEGFENACDPLATVAVGSTADADALEAWVKKNFSLLTNRHMDQVFSTRRHAAYPHSKIETLRDAQAIFLSHINAWQGI